MEWYAITGLLIFIVGMAIALSDVLKHANRSD